MRGSGSAGIEKADLNGQPSKLNRLEINLFRLALATCTIKRGLLGADYRVILCFLIDLEPRLIFLRNRHVGENSLNRAFRKACVAIDAGVRVDQQLVGQFVKSLDGANGSTVRVFTFDTRFGNDIGHFLARTPFHKGENQSKTV